MMETEDLIHLPAPTDSGCEDYDDHNSSKEPPADSEPITSEVKDEQDGKSQGHGSSDTGIEEGQLIEGTNFENVEADSQLVFQERFDMGGSVTAEISSKVHAENGFATSQDGTPISNHGIDGSRIVGVKRARMEFDGDGQNPSVFVMYNSLTRKSKQKLEQLLKQWSEWHAQHSSSSQVPNEVLESGEETYFPALHTGLEKSSAVSFWMDNQSRKESNKQLLSVDGESVPFYDRGYALGLTSEDASAPRCLGIEDASRCFNCGSYSHSMKECPKPRDNAAVSNARKQHMSKRNQNSGARNPMRYYQNSAGGKYDGLRPGALDAETRKLLGLGELDPPPWLNRMREIGYPPGYLDLEGEEQPSGITIYADGDEAKKMGKDGETMDIQHPEPQRKMTVGFPGLNAPIPENADENRWAAGASNFDRSRNQSHHRHRDLLVPSSERHYHEPRGSRDIRDDGPPGCDPETSPPRPSSYPPRYGDYDFGHSSHRSRRSPLIHEGSRSRDAYSSKPYASPSSRSLPQGYGSPVYYSPENRYDMDIDYSSYSRNDGRHRHGRR